MRKYAGMMIAAALAFGAGMLVARPAAPVESQAPSAESGFAAVPGQKGGWDLTGPYEVVPNWPKPLSQRPGHDARVAAACDRILSMEHGRLVPV